MGDAELPSEVVPHYLDNLDAYLAKVRAEDIEEVPPSSLAIAQSGWVQEYQRKLDSWEAVWREVFRHGL